MSIRLLGIEVRRSVAIWLVPLLAVFSWVLVQDRLQMTVALWVESSVAIQQTVVFAGPFVGGAAAWVAGRERRRGMDDLLRTTPRPPFSRDLAQWAATTAWGLTAYLVIATYILILTARTAAWGSPNLWLIVAGGAAIPAYAALGYAAGRSIPSRFTAPLAAMALFGIQVYVAWVIGYDRTSALGDLHRTLGPGRFLSPMADLHHSIWYGIYPNVAAFQTVWFLGLTGVVLALIALRGQRTAITWGALAAALLLAGTGAAATVQDAPEHDIRYSPGPWVDPAPVDLACSDTAFVVCVHPAFEPWLDDVSEPINRFAEPLIGLPDVPLRAEQAFEWTSGPDGEAVPNFYLDTFPSARRFVVSHTTRCLVIAGCFNNTPDMGARSPHWAQEAIYEWLWSQVPDARPQGFTDLRGPHYDLITAAAERFAALSPAEQHAWLEANIADLRAGHLTLADLP